MKQPSRMRREENTGIGDPSTYEVYSVRSDFIEPSYGTSNHSGSQLVSARYNRRRASAQSVKFTIPETSKASENNLKLFTRNLNDNSSDEETADGLDFAELGARRMSAPELPPISVSGKSSSLINNGFLTSRSSTFHNYRFKPDAKKGTRKSIHSDSSVQGFRINSQSGASSSSSQKSGARVLSAGAKVRTVKQTITPDLIQDLKQRTSFKLETPGMKNGMTTVLHPTRCTSVTGYNRNKGKTCKDAAVATPRKLVHSGSESQLNSIGYNHSKRRNSEKDTLRRNVSDKSLESKKNALNKQNNAKNDKATKHKNGLNGSVNGMRKYQSALGLNSHEGRSDEESGVTENDLDSGSENETDLRVRNWLIGVDEAEPPEEPEIEYRDEPPQRDTAIRIVYDGDS